MVSRSMRSAGSRLFDGEFHSFLGMDSGGIEQPDIGVPLIHQHADLGAPRNDSLNTSIRQIIDDAQIFRKTCDTLVNMKRLEIKREM